MAKWIIIIDTVLLDIFFKKHLGRTFIYNRFKCIVRISSISSEIFAEKRQKCLSGQVIFYLEFCFMLLRNEHECEYEHEFEHEHEYEYEYK